MNKTRFHGLRGKGSGSLLFMFDSIGFMVCVLACLKSSGLRAS